MLQATAQFKRVATASVLAAAFAAPPAQASDNEIVSFRPDNATSRYVFPFTGNYDPTRVVSQLIQTLNGNEFDANPVCNTAPGCSVSAINFYVASPVGTPGPGSAHYVIEAQQVSLTATPGEVFASTGWTEVFNGDYQYTAADFVAGKAMTIPFQTAMPWNVGGGNFSYRMTVTETAGNLLSVEAMTNNSTPYADIIHQSTTVNNGPRFDRYNSGIATAFNVTSAVPEPSTYATLGAGLAALAGVAAMRRRRSEGPSANMG